MCWKPTKAIFWRNKVLIHCIPQFLTHSPQKHKLIEFSLESISLPEMLAAKLAKHTICFYVNVNKRPIFECSLINFHFCNPENAKALHALTIAYGLLPDLFKSLYNHAWVFISQHWSCSYQFCLSWQEINLSATGHYSKVPVGLPLLISILIVTVDNGSWSGGNIRRNQWKGCDPLPKLYAAHEAGQHSHKRAFALRWARRFNSDLTCLVCESFDNTLVSSSCQ